MSTQTKWQKVNRETPCPVCGKTDWCLIAPDGSAAICPRTESPKRCGNAGYLHRLTDTQPDWLSREIILPVRQQSADLSVLAQEYARAATDTRLAQLATSLRLPRESLVAFGVGWAADRSAWAFPMTDHATGAVTNIRYRSVSGAKFSVRGGKESLFVANDFAASEELLITEGATDAIAAHALGFRMVAGRPSCTGGTAHIVGIVRATKPTRIVIIRDNDTPGIRGAESLAGMLALYSRDVRVIAPPKGTKDLRDWFASGCTREDITRCIQQTNSATLNIMTGETP